MVYLYSILLTTYLLPMGLKGNDAMIILFIGLGAICLLAVACMYRIWGFYIRKTGNKAIYLRNIRRKRNDTSPTTPPQRDLEAGETG